MVSLIQPLPIEVVCRIAAGEAIDSLGAAVRELVENALDAGATRIVVSLDPDRWSVQVSDNGCGMALADLQQAATAHSTSKIRDCPDLERITSLGFRGEALHSLAQLADLEIVSCPRDGEGWRVVYDNRGEPLRVERAAIAPGTVVMLSRLFRDWLHRRQALGRASQQLREVQQTVAHAALCHPGVTWQICMENRAVLTLSPGTMRDILPQILSKVRPDDLQDGRAEFAEAEGKAAIDLVLGLPDRCHRRRLDWVKVAVNGRVVKLPEVERAIVSAFVRTLPRDRYPLCFVHLKVAPEHIDWNRNPAKSELYLHEPDRWQQRVTEAIERSLRLSPANLAATDTQRVVQLVKAAENTGSYRVADPQKPQDLPQGLRAVAQVSNTYIVAEHATGLWLIEQHIAHERVLYEDLCDRWQLVPLEPPIVLSNLEEKQIEQLQRLGIEVDPFGEQMWAVRNIPALLKEREDGAEALIELSLGGDLQAAQVATACRSAIRNGTPMKLDRMQSLLDRWQQTRNPRTCPHGRPIYLALEETALARFFRRHWVIGKSHGI